MTVFKKGPIPKKLPKSVVETQLRRRKERRNDLEIEALTHIAKISDSSYSRYVLGFTSTVPAGILKDTTRCNLTVLGRQIGLAKNRMYAYDVPVLEHLNAVYVNDKIYYRGGQYQYKLVKQLMKMVVSRNLESYISNDTSFERTNSNVRILITVITDDRNFIGEYVDEFFEIVKVK